MTGGTHQARVARRYRGGVWQPNATTPPRPVVPLRLGITLTAEQHAAVLELIDALGCDKARYAPDVMEHADDGYCLVHCPLVTIFEPEPPR